jgi:integrase
MAREAANRINSTKAVIDALTVPGSYYDTKQPGLVLTVSPKGAKSWSIYKWDRARKQPVSKLIGPWPAFNVDVARGKARELVHAIERGEGAAPVKAKDTLGDLADRYELSLRATGAKDPAHNSDVIRLGCDDWRPRPADSITRQEVETRHNEIAAKRGPMAAARLVKSLKAIYRHADMDCPAARVRTAANRPRARVATPAELAAVRAELAKQEPYWRDYFLLSILTGARRSNVGSMRFEHVTDGVWTIPATDAKMGDPIALPLVPEAIAIIEARRADLKSGFVFPATARDGHLTHTWEKWNEIRTAAGAPDLTQHDLRRTMISRLAEAGVNPAIAAKAAGHRSVTTTLRVYTTVRQDQVLEALNRLS